MKKIIFGLMLMAAPVYSATDVREVGVDCVMGVVSVSTNTATAIPTTPFAGRYKIDILNTNNTYDVSLGTSSALSYSAGYIVTNSSDAATASHTIYLPSGKSIYGLGEGNNLTGTVNVRYLECK